MKISIITVTFNSAKTLKETIQSVIDQDYPNIEHIIVDGGSTDKTLEIVKIFEKEVPLKSISEPDNGIYDAMNKGIKMATGDIVGILNSDDFFHRKDALSLVAETFIKNNIQSLFADLIFVHPSNLIKPVRYFSSGKFMPYKFKYGYMPAHPTFYTYKQNFEIYGYYKTNYQIAADYELMLRFLFINKLPYHYLPTDLLTMRTGGISTNSFINKIKIHNKEYLRACKENGISSNNLLISLRFFTKLWGFIRKKRKNNLRNS